MIRRIFAVLAGTLLLGTTSIVGAQLNQENPPTGQIVSLSGIQVISGWKCNPGVITVSFDGGPAEIMASGTGRNDTISSCPVGNDGRNGYGLLKNVNLLGDGRHIARFSDNGVQFAEATFDVIRPGGVNFLRDLDASFDVAGFPAPGQGVSLTWVQGLQNFAISDFCDGSAANPCPPTGAFPATGQTASFVPGDDGDLRFGGALSYTDNGDGTITDNNTGLMWEKKGNDGGLHDKDNLYTWGVAPGGIFGWVAQLNAEGPSGFAGYNDWRIPNVKELQSIVNYQPQDPSISPPFNSGCSADCTVLTCSCTQGSCHFASTTDSLAPNDSAWSVCFNDGGVSRKPKTSSGYVRAVRGGSR